MHNRINDWYTRTLRPFFVYERCGVVLISHHPGDLASMLGTLCDTHLHAFESSKSKHDS